MFPILEITHVAATGGVTQYAAIVLDNSNQASLPGAANASRFGGFAQEPALIGVATRIMKLGISYAVAAAAFNPGEELVISGVTGKVCKAGTTNDVIQNVVAIAEEAATADGDIVLVRIAPYAKKAFEVISLRATDLVASDATVYGINSPIAGTIVNVRSVLKGHALAAGDATLTGKIGGTAITTGVVTIPLSSSAIGDKQSVVPTAANVVAVGDEIQFLVGGANTNTAAFAEISMLVKL